jgi:hypothetical protein
VKYFDRNIKQIYIIDDICGKCSVDQSMINSWDSTAPQLPVLDIQRISHLVYFLKQQTSYKEEETYYMRLGLWEEDS